LSDLLSPTLQAGVYRVKLREILGGADVLYFFPSQFHHMSLMDFVVSPPGCGWSVTDFLGWDAHEAQLRFPDEVDGDIWIW
jgi:hypothetical protein